MVSQEAIWQNQQKLHNIRNTIYRMIELHDTARYSYIVDGVEKNLPQEDINNIIEKYQTLKTELQNKFKELL